VKLTVYLETTVPSYYVSCSSRDVLILAHQQVTRDWWTRRLPDFRAFVSPVVLEEARRGDPQLAIKRLEALSGIDVLEATPEVESLAARYANELRLPDAAIRDAAHLAFACVYELDFLVTWNCAHIANGENIRRLAKFNAIAGISTPTICTPEELSAKDEG
jgi:hypothetical protein